MAASNVSRRAKSSQAASRRSRLAIAIAVAAAEGGGGLLSQRACAANTVDTFTGGAGSGAWETGNNWTNSAPPGNSTTNALINFSSGVTFTGAGGFNTAGQLLVGVGGNLSGVSATGNGALTIGNGTLTVTGFNIGDGGNSSIGTLTVNGGNLTVTGGTDYIGQSTSSTSPATGTLSLSAGTLSLSGELDIGNVGNGTLNVTGGNLTSTNALYLNNFAGSSSSNSIANVSGGNVSVAQLYVGGANITDANTQFFNQSGGNVTVTSTSGANFRIGRSATALAVYNLTGGTLTTYCDMYFGTNTGSNATLNVGGGALIVGNSTLTASLHVGGYSATSTNTQNSSFLATVNQTGGTVAIGSASTNGLYFDSGTSGSPGNGTRIYSLAGGTLTTPWITAGNLTAGGNNVFSFNGGTLQAQTGGNATQYGSFMSGLSNATVYSGNATIDTNGQNITIAQPLLAPTGSGLTDILYSGGVGYNGDPRVTITGGTGIPATAVAVVSNGNVASITITSPGSYSSVTGLTVTISGNLQPGGTAATVTGNTTATVTSGGVTKIGTGTLTLSGSNNYTGVTTISAGTLEFANEASLYGNTTASWTAANLVVNSGATAALMVGGAGQFTSSDIQTLSLLGSGSGGFESGSILGLDTTSGNFTYASTIANPNSNANVLGLTKLGANTLTLSASNSYTGLTNLNAGTLSLGNTSALAGGGNITFTGGTLQFTANNTNDYSNRIVNSTSAPISIDTNGQTVNFTGTLASSNTDGLVKTGAGTLYLQNVQNYSGGVILSAGTLAITQGPGLGALVTSPAAQLTFAGNSTLQIRSATQFLSGRTFVIDTGVTGSIDTDGTTGNVLPQLISGGGALAKIGLGDMALQGNNTYSGGTTVSMGTLFANNTAGSATGSGNVNVAATASGNYTGGILGGNGTVSGNITLAAGSAVRLGGIIAAGPSSSITGTLSTGNQTWNAGAVYAWKVAALGNTTTTATGGSGTAGTAATWDKLAMSGLTLSSLGGSSPSFTIEMTDATSLTPGIGTYSWIIATSSGNVTAPGGYNIYVNGSTADSNLLAAGANGGAAAFALDTAGFNVTNGFSTDPGAFTLELVSAGSSGDNLVLDYNAAPEPGAAILASLGAVPLLGARRRRRRSIPAEGS